MYTGLPYISEINDNIINEIKRRSKTPLKSNRAFFRVKSNVNVEGEGNGLMLEMGDNYYDIYGIRNSVKIGKTSVISENSSGIARNIKKDFTKEITNSLNNPALTLDNLNVSSTGDNNMLRKATIEFTVGSKDILDKIDPYFFTPGMTLAVDWGWITQSTMSELPFYSTVPLIDMFDLNELRKCYEGEETENGKITGFEYVKKNYIDKSNGNYNVLVGVITNYSYQRSDNNTWKCSVEIKSLGHSGLYTSTNKTGEEEKTKLFTFKDLIIDKLDLLLTKDSIINNLSAFFKIIPNKKEEIEDAKNRLELKVLNQKITEKNGDDSTIKINGISLSTVMALIETWHRLGQQGLTEKTKQNAERNILSKRGIKWINTTDNFPLPILPLTNDSISSITPEKIMYNFRTNNIGFERHINIKAVAKDTKNKWKKINQDNGDISYSYTKFYPEDEYFFDKMWIEIGVVRQAFEKNDNCLDALDFILNVVNASIDNVWDLKSTIDDSNRIVIVNRNEIIKDNISEIPRFEFEHYSNNPNSILTELTIETDLPADLANEVVASRHSPKTSNARLNETRITDAILDYNKKIKTTKEYSSTNGDINAEDSIRNLNIVLTALESKFITFDNNGKVKVKSELHQRFEKNLLNALKENKLFVWNESKYKTKNIQTQLEIRLKETDDWLTLKSTAVKIIIGELKEYIALQNNSDVLDKPGTPTPTPKEILRQNMITLTGYPQNEMPLVKINVSMGMIGISGIINGNRINIHENIMPSKFVTRDDIFLVATEYSDSVSSDGNWITNISCLVSI